jgi:hypothetical protein
MKVTSFYQWLSHHSQRWLLAVLISLTALLLAGLASYPVFSAQAPTAELELDTTVGLSLATPPAIAKAELPQATPSPPVNSRPGQAVLHPLGIGLAFLFIVLMVSLFRWMFSVPPQLP